MSLCQWSRHPTTLRVACECALQKSADYIALTGKPSRKWLCANHNVSSPWNKYIFFFSYLDVQLFGQPALWDIQLFGHPALLDIQLFGHPALLDIQLFGHPALSDIQLFRTSSFIGHPALSDIQLYWTSNSIGHPALSKFPPLSDIQLYRTSSWQTSNCRKPPAGPVFSHIIWTEWTVTERHMIRYIILMQVLKLWQVVKSLQMCTKHYQYFK